MQDSKFKVYNYPPALPNKCVGCLAGHPGDKGERAFIDTGMTLDWYGAVYICTLCFVEMANTFGHVSYEQYAKVMDISSELSLTNYTLRKENEALRAAVSALSDHRCSVSAKPDVPSVLEPNPVREADTVPNPPEGNDTESDVSEPASVEGLPSVRGNAGVHAERGGKQRPKDAIDELGI